MKTKIVGRSCACAGASALALAIAMVLPSPGRAQVVASGAVEPGGQAADAPTAAQEIVVTGFRASLNSALGQKRKETAAVDSIVAEDIGKFPDSNLAESMQRIPGVALARGDGGEGRNISVRGLGAGFTRVRLNGMEGTSQTGSSDIYGGGNNGRSFDFNVFPTEIFSELTVRKTPSADVEDGSLGATVDLMAPHPLSQKEDFVLSATIRGVYGELSKRVDPRGSVLVSKKFDDGRFGILGSFAYQKRHIREVGYSAVDILSANTNGFFCSPVGMTPVNPALSPAKGTTATDCSTGNPRTSSLDAYQALYNARRADMPNTPGSGAFLPRIPRYTNSTQNQERIGGTLSLQFQPDDKTDMSLDLLYSRFHVKRNDNYIEAISFGRSASNNGQPMTSVRDIDLSQNGSLLYGLFDGVDVRSEGLRDDFVTTFKQANFNVRHDLTDRLRLTAMVGLNESKWVERERLQYFMDAIDTDNFSIDSRNGSTPVLGFGFDVSDPNSFQYAPSLADGTVLGGFSEQGKPSVNRNLGLAGEANLEWKATDWITLKAGAQYRRSDFTLKTTNYYTADTLVTPFPAGTSLADITREITGVDKLWGHGAPSSWAAIDPDKLTQVFNLDAGRRCYVSCGATSNRVLEEVSSAYAMGTFDLGDRFGFGVRGDVGVRYVHTAQLSSAYIPLADATSPTGLGGQYKQVTRSYDDWLPSANIVIEPVHNLLVRLSGSKVLARAELASLVPTSSVNPITRSGSVGNPLLDPIRANTFDAALEWYFRPGSLLSAAFFYKDIKTYVQSVNSLIPFSQLGLPDALLNGSNTQPTELFAIAQPENTPGGPLKGVELNAQVPLTFLPGVFRNFGVLANYTHVISKIQYILASVNGVPTVTTTADLVGLSKNTASATLYYEDKKFSIRGTANYRDGFIRGIPASPGSDLQGNSSTIYVDASMSYDINDRLKVIVEGQNLTDEQNRLYTDSVRNDTLFQTRVGRTITFGVNFRM
ncbi:TonB-dependent receptor [Sphingomonas oligoaromativorans]|uniref:TonB-dependent receptor n=1 Tax=Sphingomonas oligoaromativorans TaxID=575322 RepID=UPI00142437DC|nr:TonB-dependent receptor [Sphingomonas oligoaromativorans]NIJ35239.1 TonB-dependent receptor [Sphingomonas oligoaromativorans]